MRTATPTLTGLTPWQEKLGGAALCTVPGILMRLGGGVFPAPLLILGYGAAVVAAAFLLAWACEAAQVDIAHGLVVAIVAFVAILPEYIVEVHFAFTGRADYVTANLTGAIRLLLGCCVGLPAVVALLPSRRRRRETGPVKIASAHRLELAILGIAAIWALRGVVRGELGLLDSLVLISLYGFYLYRVAKTDGEQPPLVGVAAQLAELPPRTRRLWVRAVLLYAAVVILITAVPFGDAVLASGQLVGISPYLMLQWLVPIATEMPELVVAFVLLLHGRGGQSVAVLLAGAVSQYTLAMGTLPVAFAVGAGTGPLPLAPREQIELLLTIGVAMYAIAALVRLRLSRGDASIMLVLFAIQFLVPSTIARLALAVVFVALAIDVLAAERRYLPPLLGALRPRAAPT